MSRISPRDPRPPYVQIADDLRARIRTGDLAPGDQLSSGRHLAREYGVAAMTIQHALRVLREEGLITTWQGRGVFVSDPLPDISDETSEQGNTYEQLLDRVKDLDTQVQKLGEWLARLEARQGERQG